jgi:hypothetical protein
MCESCFFVGTVQRFCFFRDDFHSDSPLHFTVISVTQRMARDAGTPVWSVLSGFNASLNSR